MTRATELAAAVVLTVGLEIAVGAARPLLVHDEADEVFAMWALGAACLCAVALLVGLASRHAVPWLWLGMLTLPLALAAASRWTFDADLPLNRTLGVLTLGEFAAVARVLPDFLWVGGASLAGWRRLGGFLPVVALWGQACAVGLQVVVPGAIVFGVWALLPVVAARHSDRWLGRSAEAITRVTGAWLLASGCLVVAVIVPDFVLASLVAGDPELVLQDAMITDDRLGSSARVTGAVGGQLAGGIALALAAYVYDLATSETVRIPEAGRTDRDNPFAAG